MRNDLRAKAQSLLQNSKPARHTLSPLRRSMVSISAWDAEENQDFIDKNLRPLESKVFLPEDNNKKPLSPPPSPTKSERLSPIEFLKNLKRIRQKKLEMRSPSPQLENPMQTTLQQLDITGRSTYKTRPRQTISTQFYQQQSLTSKAATLTLDPQPITQNFPHLSNQERQTPRQLAMPPRNFDVSPYPMPTSYKTICPNGGKVYNLSPNAFKFKLKEEIRYAAERLHKEFLLQRRAAETQHLFQPTFKKQHYRTRSLTSRRTGTVSPFFQNYAEKDKSENPSHKFL